MFDGYIRDHAVWSPRACAVLLPDRRVSYAELDADVDRLAAALADQGVSRETGVVSVAVAAPYLQYAVTAALARLDTPSSPAADDRADLQLVDAEPGSPGPARRLQLSRAWFAEALAAERRRIPARSYDPLALGRVMLSSGTTGAARRVPFSWRRLEQGNHATLRNSCNGRRGCWIPMTGIDSMMGLALVMGGWSVGACVVNALPLAAMPAWLEQLDPGVLSLTPSQLRAILDAAPDGFRPQPRWRIVCGGAALPLSLAEAARLRLTPDIRLLYGATETGTIALGDVSGLADAPGQIGITPAGTTAVMFGEDGQPVADGDAGEIRVRGPGNAPGYLGDPEATAERFRDGWFLTGDVGRRLADGRLVLEGRLEDRMNLDGRKVLPGPLEAAALTRPGVRDAVAFSAAGADGVETCWLAIVAGPGFDRDSLAEGDVWADLPAFRVAWIDEVPRNAMGRPDRAVLRAAVLAAVREN